MLLYLFKVRSFKMDSSGKFVAECESECVLLIDINMKNDALCGRTLKL